MIKRIFNYIQPIWTSKDNKPSIRRLLSLYFSILFVIEMFVGNPNVEILWCIAAMIGGLLSLTTVQNIGFARISRIPKRENDSDETGDLIDKVED